MKTPSTSYRTIEVCSSLIKGKVAWVDMLCIKSLFGTSKKQSLEFCKNLGTVQVRLFLVTHYSNGKRRIEEVKK